MSKLNRRFCGINYVRPHDVADYHLKKGLNATIQESV